MQYLVKFRCTFGKVALIKAVRCFGPYGLKKAKEIIEERYGYSSDYYPNDRREFEWLMDDTHLGYYYANSFLDGEQAAYVVDVRRLTGVHVDLSEYDPAIL